MVEAFEWVEGEALRARLGSPHFTAAVHTPGNVLMDPPAPFLGLDVRARFGWELWRNRHEA